MPTLEELQAALNQGGGGGQSGLQLKDFEGGAITVLTPDGGTVNGVLQWDPAVAKDAPLSGWRITTNNGRVPVQANSVILTDAGAALTIGAQGTIIDKRAYSQQGGDITPSAALPGWYIGPNGQLITPDDIAGASGGAGRAPQIVGARAPDPVSAGNMLLGQYDRLVQAGQISAQDAADAWTRDWNVIKTNSDISATNVGNKLNADTTNAGLQRDYAQLGQTRAANVFNAGNALNSQATDRANIVRAMLPSMLPNGVGLNLQGAGPVPQNPVNIDQLLSQGLPALSDQYNAINSLFPAIGAPPTVTAGTVNPIDRSQLPTVMPTQLPPMPDLSPYINAANAGFGGWAY